MTEPKQRFLVLSDYGMGGRWWWVRARSARQVLETFAEVEVVDLAESIEWARAQDLEEVDVDDRRTPTSLDDLRARRDGQRRRPGFGALVGKPVVHLRLRGEDLYGDSSTYLIEVGPDGRRLRQVELTPDGDALRSGPEDWVFNPPVVDLFDPDLVGKQISRHEFEPAWHRARPDESLY